MQPVGGFSAILDAGHGTFYAMPDNGFGTKANSRSFILRLYKVRPDWRAHTVTILNAISLRDPDLKVPFPIVNETTPDRILTGGDFDEGISLIGARPGDLGLGNPFKFLYQTVEAIVPVDRHEFAVVNDTNFGSTGRNPNLPDYSDFIIVKAR